jgi:very-short-patch-repair endonuclease
MKENKRNKIISYNPKLRELARELRKNSTPAEIVFWKMVKGKALGVEFHRQVPMLNYIVDFYCHEIGLAIELDGTIHDDSFLEDAKRQGELEQQGVVFLRFSNEEVPHYSNHVLNILSAKILDLNSDT